MRVSALTIWWLGIAGLCLMAAPLYPPLLPAAIGLDVLLAVLLVADAALLRRAMTVTARREHEDILSLGASNLVTLLVENPTPFTFRLTLRDALPDSFESAEYTGAGKLAPYATFQLAYHITPLQRGEYRFGPLTIRLKTSLGLWIGQRAFELDDRIKVYPNIQQTKQQHLLSRRLRSRQMGLRALRLLGQGMEFESLRDYLPDDELRRVDWKASARRGNLVTREYDIERSQQIMLVLDLGRAMASHLDYMTKLDHAINASVLLTYVAAQAQDRIGVMAFADEVVTFMPPGKGAGQLPLVLDQLYPLHPRQLESNYRDAFTFLAQRQRKRSLMVIFTDLIDPDSSKRLLNSLSLLHPQHLVLCVALSDYELKGILSGAPANHTGMYQQAVATSVLEDRQLALAQLHQRGILTVDAAPSDLSVAVVNRYLAIKREGRV
ncbi:MAG: DUF58 domain-containing protein [Armatimonadota bacterium]